MIVPAGVVIYCGGPCAQPTANGIAHNVIKHRYNNALFILNSPPLVSNRLGLRGKPRALLELIILPPEDCRQGPIVLLGRMGLLYQDNRT